MHSHTELTLCYIAINVINLQDETVAYLINRAGILLINMFFLCLVHAHLKGLSKFLKLAIQKCLPTAFGAFQSAKILPKNSSDVLPFDPTSLK